MTETEDAPMLDFSMVGQDDAEMNGMEPEWQDTEISMQEDSEVQEYDMAELDGDGSVNYEIDVALIEEEIIPAPTLDALALPPSSLTSPALAPAEISISQPSTPAPIDLHPSVTDQKPTSLVSQSPELGAAVPEHEGVDPQAEAPSKVHDEQHLDTAADGQSTRHEAATDVLDAHNEVTDGAPDTGEYPCDHVDDMPQGDINDEVHDHATETHDNVEGAADETAEPPTLTSDGENEAPPTGDTIETVPSRTPPAILLSFAPHSFAMFKLPEDASSSPPPQLLFEDQSHMFSQPISDIFIALREQFLQFFEHAEIALSVEGLDLTITEVSTPYCIPFAQS
jgi:hypothetical protein